jgi:hypothetical protein
LMVRVVGNLGDILEIPDVFEKVYALVGRE